MEQVESHTGRLLHMLSADGFTSSAFHFFPGDVLYGRLRPYLNKVHCAAFEGLCSAEFIVLPKSAAIDSQFLAHYLRTSEFVAFANSLNQGDRPRVSFDQLSDYPVPLPPYSEQQRIAAKLELLLATVSACQKRLAGIQQILARFRQAVLAAACSGESVPLKTLASFTYGTSSKSKTTGKVPVLRMGNLKNGEIDWTDLVYTSDPDESNKYQLARNTVLFNRTNSPELVGKSSIYRGERPAIFAGYLIRIDIQGDLDPEYLNYCLNAPAARQWCHEVKTDGVSQSNINAAKLGDFPLPYRSLHEQRQVVSRVKALFALADRIETRYRKAQAEVEKLTQSILARAFAGKLVPTEAELAETEGRGYETAAELLDRIKRADSNKSKENTNLKRTHSSRHNVGAEHTRRQHRAVDSGLQRPLEALH
jgi:type I restriction enzyme S subunit